MNLSTALTEAARVAVAEGARYEQAMSLDRRDSWSVISKDGKLTYLNGTSAQCDEWIAHRVNAAVFAWWAENVENMPWLWNVHGRNTAKYPDYVDYSPNHATILHCQQQTFKALASGDAS